ncbi:MAG: flagellar hook-length control protein FliK [Lachnospiraceae bacterium]
MQGLRKKLMEEQERLKQIEQQTMEQLKNAVGKAQDVQNTTYTAATTESIMNQITEAVKMTMKEDMTQMELQLHPASLGNVRVQVAAKDGVITASFTTQNEQVKAALESQIVVLKENFEQQGIKVEAVEVTVASHAFERNLDSNENSSKDQMTEKKKAVRRINLSNVTDDFEEEGLLEEEKIVADMMRQNGNTVDYTA